MPDALEVWDLWLPGPGASGLPFARSKVAAADVADRVLVHAAPKELNVTVSDLNGTVLARGDNLKRGQPGPMSFLIRKGEHITLEDGWPTDADLGRVVLLPGGEAGRLLHWWHAADHSEWRWQVEFYNRI